MEILLKIERNDDCTCNPNCIFLNADHFQHTGTCFLFKKTLTPELEYGDIIGWDCCKACNAITSKILSIAAEEGMDVSL